MSIVIRPLYIDHNLINYSLGGGKDLATAAGIASIKEENESIPADTAVKTGYYYSRY